ncbi:MAG: HAMP domain-containing histidine kinase [Lachnospiraceae bacterium]|nr:HAMP domain-containing histidine kinase [Lachnospiraceae bacterium]
MINRLRKQFILVTMISSISVLTIIIGALNIFNYISIINKNDNILNILSDNEGRFPDEFLIPGEDPYMDFPFNRFTREMPFETRFFSVGIDSFGDAFVFDTSRISALNEEEVVVYAEEAFEKYQKTSITIGTKNKYRYKISRNILGYNVMFVDMSKEIYDARRVLISSISVSVLGLLCVFILVCLLSKKVFKPVEESYEKQKRFITDASHELKTPLTIIEADNEVLEMENGESEWSKSISNQIKRMSSLVEKMVTLSRMDEGDKLDIRKISLSETMEDAVGDYYNLVSKNNKKLSVDIEKDIYVSADETKIRQMCGLLLDNAVKYATPPANSENKETLIEVNLKSKGNKAVLTFKNTTDMEEDGDMNILFERFYRRDASRNSKSGGSGIGLSIVKSIVQLHKGKIKAYAKKNESITFEIALNQIR